LGTRRPAQDRQVDRQFNPRRYDAAQAIQSFSARLRDQLDLDTLTSELVAVVQLTMQPTQASIWLRLASAPTPRHQPGDNCHRGSFMSRKRISSAQTRSASTRLRDPDPTTPAQQIRELRRVGDRLISVAVVYRSIERCADLRFCRSITSVPPSYRNIE
jgi:hypothetical protein